MTESLTRALTAVLEPAPGHTVPMCRIHRAVVDHLGHDRGASYRALKAILRAAGIVVTHQSHGAEHYAHGVTLTNPRGSANNA